MAAKRAFIHRPARRAHPTPPDTPKHCSALRSGKTVSRAKITPALRRGVRRQRNTPFRIPAPADNDPTGQGRSSLLSRHSAHAGLPARPVHPVPLSGRAKPSAGRKSSCPRPRGKIIFTFFIIAQHSGLCKPDFPLRPPSLTGFSGKLAAGPKICADFCARCTLIYPTGYDIIKLAIR